MKLYCTLLVCLFFIFFPNITKGVEVSKELSDAELRDALIQGFTKLGETLEKADPRDIQAFQNMSLETMLFIRYLSHCLNALPTPTSGMKSMSATPWPPSFDIKLKYPLTIKTEIVPKDNNDHSTILFMKKAAADSSWEITEGWLQSKKSEQTSKIVIPSTEQQKIANEVLLRLLSDKVKNECE